MPALTDPSPSASPPDAIGRFVAQLPPDVRASLERETSSECVDVLVALATAPAFVPKGRRHAQAIAAVQRAQDARSTSAEPEPAPTLEPLPGPRAQRRAAASRERAAGARPTRRRPRDRMTAELQAAKERRRQKRDDKHLARARARDQRYRTERAARGQPVPGEARPASWSRDVWTMRTDSLCDASGRAMRIWLRRTALRYPHAVGAIRRAALVPVGDGTVYTFADERARKVGVALLALLLQSRRMSRMRALRDRHGRWCHLTTGITIGYVQALLANPWTGEIPSRTAVCGWPRPAGDRVLHALRARRMPCDDATAVLMSGQCGYLVAGKLAGFMFSRQPRPELGDHLFPDELMTGGEGRYAPARYVIIGRPIDQTLVPQRHLGELVALEALGWIDLGDDPKLTRRERARWRAVFVEPLPAGPEPDD